MPRLVFTNIVGSTIGIANSNAGFAKGFSIPAAGLTKDISGAELEQLAPQLDAHRNAGRLSWTQGGDPAVSDAMELSDSVGVANVMPTFAYAAKSVTAVHAAFAGNNASKSFPGPFTNPASPRNFSVTAAASYDGGTVTLTGTDQFDVPQTEAIIPVAGSTVFGVKIWKTNTSAVRSAVGANAAAVSIGTGDKLGATLRLATGTAGMLFAGASLALSVPEVVTVDAATSGFTPTTVPNGTVLFTPVLNVIG